MGKMHMVRNAILSAVAAALAAVPAQAGGGNGAPSAPAGAQDLPFVQLSPLISNDDYPADSMHDEEEGTVEFTILVGKDGRVSDCTVTSSSGSERLDRVTCRLISQRARLEPARDARGKPVERSLRSRLTWRLSA